MLLDPARGEDRNRMVKKTYILILLDLLFKLLGRFADLLFHRVECSSIGGVHLLLCLLLLHQSSIEGVL